jgi:hypothetical protein
LVAKMIAGYVVGREAVTSEEANDWLAEFCGARRERRVLLLSNQLSHRGNQGLVKDGFPL